MKGPEIPVHGERMAGRRHLTEAIIESAIDGIISIDAKGIVHSFNAAAERIFGYSREEAIGRNISFLMPWPDRDQHDHYISRYLASREPRVIGSERDLIGRRKEGGEVHVRLAVAEYEEHAQTMFVGFVQDMTELQRSRMKARNHLEKLAHLHRVNAMGQMATGMAHEIRQPLMAIQAYAMSARELIEANGSPDAKLDDILNQIIGQSAHANDIIRQMRLFLKKGQSLERETVDIISVANNVLTLLSHEVKSADIRFESDVGRPPCLCRVNRIQVEQVLYNLISNAIDSLQESGRGKILRLSCEPHDTGEQCVITVQDNGTGIPEEHKDQLWDPFFTTKTHGIGQGLAICKSILEDHGGELSVENAADGGAVFRFTLPLAQGE